MLYHGTRGTKPAMVYNSKEGFDMRYSHGGTWGFANYFAVNASYSDKYHHPHNEMRQMFYAQVMIGNTIVMQPNNGLKMPPPLNAANPNDLYDSV